MKSDKKTPDWYDQFPLNTFKGETKAQLIVLIEHLLGQKDTDWAKKIRKLGLPRIPSLLDMSDEDIYKIVGKSELTQELLK